MHIKCTALLLVIIINLPSFWTGTFYAVAYRVMGKKDKKQESDSDGEVEEEYSVEKILDR